MIKKKIEECIRLTETILTEHFCQGVCQDTLKKHIHKNCLWIGSIAGEYTIGKEQILYTLYKEAGNLPIFTLSSKEFECVAHDRKMAVISGRYIGCTVENSNEIFRDMQRVTFVWKEEEGVLWLMHFHVSNPMTNVEKDEGFPHALGTFTKEYMDMVIRKDIEKSGILYVKDQEYVYHNIQITNIIYMEAFSNNTLIHTVKGDILARILFNNLLKQLDKLDPGLFVRVQKSFSVNRFYVDTIQRYELQVAGKYKVPVSKGRYLKVKDILHNGEEEIES